VESGTESNWKAVDVLFGSFAVEGYNNKLTMGLLNGNRSLICLVGVASIVAFLPFLLSVLPPTNVSSKNTVQVQYAIDVLHLKESYSISSSQARSSNVAKGDNLSTSTTNTNASTSSIDYESIIEKWQLPKAAIPLLKQIQSRPVGFDYNRTSDILAFRHPLKTGGTSFSIMLKETFKDQVLPGSAPSDWFRHNILEKALQKHPIDESSSDDYWRNMAVLYTHSYLRPKGKRQKNLLEDLRETIPILKEKRFRLMTIVRRPLDLAASSYYETLCRIGKISGARTGSTNLITDISECPKINLTDVKRKIIERQQNICQKQKDANLPYGLTCKQMIAVGEQKHFAYCGSIDELLESKKVHNQHYKTLMGDLPEPPVGVVGKQQNSKTPTMEDVALYTIRDLGGLVDFDERYKEDFIWFSVTERMKESLCLFYYKFKINPVQERKSL